jgi:hypothetical protein
MKRKEKKRKEKKRKEKKRKEKKRKEKKKKKKGLHTGFSFGGCMLIFEMFLTRVLKFGRKAEKSKSNKSFSNVNN